VNLWNRIPELPLLKRELIELANRRRTYIVRSVGAIVLLLIVYVRFQSSLQTAAGMNLMFMPGAGPAAAYNPNKFLGSGGWLFTSLVPLLFWSVELLMPALICGAITMEKERNTLGTLFVTRLTPFTIVLEKLGSRLVPMFTFLLLTFPMLAFVYSLGGVDTTLLLATLWLLLCECLLFASIGLMCSSWFATTVTAFIWSYVLTGLLVLLGLLAQSDRGPLADLGLMFSPHSIWSALASSEIASTTGGMGIPGMGPSSDIDLKQDPADPAWINLIRAVRGIVWYSLPVIVVSAGCLLLARVFLIRRAFVSSSSVLLRLFKRVDAFFHRLNQQTTGGIVLIKDRDSMPLFDPVAWRERTRKSLGKARYLIRILILLEGPVLFICLMAATSGASSTGTFDALRGLLGFAWGLAALMVIVKCATLMSSERARETLDVLLSTPMTLREILTQKIAGARRLMMVVAIPVLTVNFTLLLMHFDLRTLFRDGSFGTIINILSYAVLTVAATAVVMHEVAWLSTLCGLRSKSQTRSVMTAMGVIGGWIILSLMLASPGGLAHRMTLSVLMSGSLADGDVMPLNRQLRYLSDGESIELLELNATAGILLSCLRPDGSVQANEAVLIAATYGTTSRAAVSLPGMLAAPGPAVAVFGAVVVLLWHAGVMLCFRWLALKLAPRVMNRVDFPQKPAVSDSPSLGSSGTAPPAMPLVTGAAG
jgi:ABC-type transport system involved in multi-copper enzyme maturation permease subunit